jgi:hypothetical protein
VASRYRHVDLNILHDTVTNQYKNFPAAVNNQCRKLFHSSGVDSYDNSINFVHLFLCSVTKQAPHIHEPIPFVLYYFLVCVQLLVRQRADCEKTEFEILTDIQFSQSFYLRKSRMRNFSYVRTYISVYM